MKSYVLEYGSKIVGVYSSKDKAEAQIPEGFTCVGERIMSRSTLYTYAHPASVRDWVVTEVQTDLPL